MIDHTNLKPDATETDIRKLCKEAEEYGFAAVCVNPRWVRWCRDNLRFDNLVICSVVGFPLGATFPRIKAQEAQRAYHDGAQEIDMVVDIGSVKSGRWRDVENDIACVRTAISGVTLKVIFECCLLTKKEKTHLCEIAKECNVDFLKTSTGFSTGGATVEDVRLMRKTVGPDMGIKAAGGIRTYKDARAMIEAGATRLGCSAGIQIIKEERQFLQNVRPC